MATRRRAPARRRAASASRPARTTKRRSSRRNTLNAATKKKLAGTGMAIGVATVAAPIALSMIKSRSVEPAKSLANVGVLVEMGKRAAFGYGIGYAAGMVVDKTPLKRPVNKALKLVGMRRWHTMIFFSGAR